MSHDSAQSDVVKKGQLKYRASKVKGTDGSSAQGPKSAKPLFVVFRAMHTGDKILHIYVNDKRYHEAENPKWRVYLHDATSVYFLTDKKSFCVSMSDGGLLFFDASSPEEAEEWVRCLNAVLYAKGIGGESTLQYEVEMLPSSIISHHGPATLELRDHDLIIWRSDTWDEVVRWKLNHLRSFKAKKYKLTIVAGKRSCTGLGEFVFNSNHSIQITHAIETIVAKVKYRSSPVPSSKSPARPPQTDNKPRLQLPASIPDMRDPRHSSGSHRSVISGIPDFAPPDLVNPDALSPVEEYGKLEHATGGHSASNPNLRPNNLLLETPGSSAGAYDRMDRQTGSKSPRNSPPRGAAGESRHTPPRRNLPSPPREIEEYGKLDHTKAKGKNFSPSPPPPIKHARSKPGYEDIDLDLPPTQNGPEEYGKLERVKGGKSSPSPPAKHMRPSKPGYEDIDLDLPPMQNGPEEYGKLDRNNKRGDLKSPLPVPPVREKSKSPVMPRRGGPPPTKPNPYTGALSPEARATPPIFPPPAHDSKRKVTPPDQEDYGHLDHHVNTSGTGPSPSTDDVYDVADEVTGQVVHPEQYTKLSHTHFTSQSEEEYGKLDSKTSQGGSLKRSGVPGGSGSVMEASRIKTRHTVHAQLHTKPQVGGAPLQEEYGKLDRSPKGGEARAALKRPGLGLSKQTSVHTPLTPSVHTPLTPGGEDYGRLERAKAVAPHTTTNTTTAGGFDPYAAMDPERASITSNSSVDSGTKVAGALEEAGGRAGEPSNGIYSTLNNVYTSDDKKKEPDTPGPPIYSTVQKPKKKKNNKTKPAPPPGYENTVPLNMTPAQLAAQSPGDSPVSTPPAVPPRGASDRSRLRYENIGEDGKVMVLPETPSSEVPHILTKQFTSTDNDYTEDIEHILANRTKNGNMGGASKPTPAPKPKVKPRPKPRT